MMMNNNKYSINIRIIIINKRKINIYFKRINNNNYKAKLSNFYLILCLIK